SEVHLLRADFEKYVDVVKGDIKKHLDVIGESRRRTLDFEQETAEARSRIMQAVKDLQLDDAKAVGALVSVRAEPRSPPQSLNVRVGFVSEVSEVGIDELWRVATALQKQVSRDLKPIWKVDAKIEVFKSLEAVPTGVWPMIIKKDIGVPGAAGIHLEKDGVP